jgi:PAS domain S-box-containing protein
VASGQSSLRLPRRTSGYFLLFFAAGAIWIAVGAWLLVNSDLRRRAEEDRIALMRRTCQQIQTADLRNNSPELQSTMIRLRVDAPIGYCCIVSSNGRILAHSSPEAVGQLFLEPTAHLATTGDVEQLRLPVKTGGSMVEYRIAVENRVGEKASLHMAFIEPQCINPSNMDRVSLLMLGLGPAFCIAAGVATLRRLVLPLAAVEAQLGRVATSIRPTELPLDEVTGHGAAATGWNRLVEAHNRQRETSGLEQRVSAGLQAAAAARDNSVLDSLPDGVAVAHSDGRVLFANRAFGAICGFAAGTGSLSGKMIEELLDLRGKRDEAQAILASGLGGRAVVADVRTTLAGSPRVLRVGRYPIWDSEGQVDGSRQVWSVRDITQQQLVSQTRDQFLQTAAHELRTPLANIKAYAETLSLDDTIDPDGQREFFNIINAEATRLARLIEDLLSVSSMEAGALSATREETDFGRLAGDVIEKVKPLMEQRGLEFATTLPAKWPKMHIDKDKIAATLVNVLGNAAKYTPAGGRVGFHISSDETRLTIAVEDTGFGISAAELPRISEKFFRSSDPRVREQPGSGLGLSLVKEVVRLHGGQFEIQSEVDVGTTVRIMLPIA